MYPPGSTIFEPLLALPPLRYAREPYQLADRTNFYALVNKSVKFNARDEMKSIKKMKEQFTTLRIKLDFYLNKLHFICCPHRRPHGSHDNKQATLVICTGIQWVDGIMAIWECVLSPGHPGYKGLTEWRLFGGCFMHFYLLQHQEMFVDFPLLLLLLGWHNKNHRQPEFIF